MINQETLENLDLFFYSGENDIETEIENELVSGLMQKRRSLFYNRRDGCGIAERENYPNSLTFNIRTRYDIAIWNSYRNSYISDGSIDGRDKRVSISQNGIDFQNDKKGNVDVFIYYIPFINYKQPKSVRVPILISGV